MKITKNEKEVIKDTGNRVNFSTGAVKDISPEKGRYDLLPLHQLADLFYEEGDVFTYQFIWHVGNFEKNGAIADLIMALEILIEKGIKGETDKLQKYYKFVMMLSKRYEDALTKYPENNWKKGIPVHCFIDSALRHFFQYRMGMTDEDHFTAVGWNLLGAMWTVTNLSEMCDLPFMDKMKEEDKKSGLAHPTEEQKKAFSDFLDDMIEADKKSKSKSKSKEKKEEVDLTDPDQKAYVG